MWSNVYKYLLEVQMRSKLKDKKAAKKLLKRAKKHPDWYSEQDIYYAKMVKKRIKEEESNEKSVK